ncbi:hypothetical protein Taro_015700 [Colocasia esculenta]|uniref:Uncharacterized protein n=1 Tax=Colocasia esculenta TaxID=4460 RepID=A0A843UMZ6_COLES|nr:hypothetical protein [Colocasia esculenta]
MAPKQAPRHGAKSKAAAKGVVIEEPPVERRSKFRHDPSKRKQDSSHSGTSSKRGRSTPQRKGKSPMPSRYPKRKVLQDSSDSDEDGTSFDGTPSTNPKRQLIEESSSDTSGTPVATSSKTVSEGRSILKLGAVDLSDQAFADAFPEFITFFEFQRVEGDQVFRGPVVEPSPANLEEEHVPELEVPQGDPVEQPHAESEIPQDMPVLPTPQASPTPQHGHLGRRGEALADKHTLVLTIFQCGTKEYLYTAPPVKIKVCGSHEDEMLG